MLRSMNYSAEATARYQLIDLSSDGPEALAVRSRQPIFIESVPDYQTRFPRSAERVHGDLKADHEIAAIACLPLVVAGEVLGVIAVAFALREERTLDADERVFLTVGAGHCALGLNRARTYEAEQRARHEMALLYELVDAASRASTLESVYELGLNALETAFDVARSAILLFDADGAMRFKAWHGLSDAYRAAVDGHSPWSTDMPANRSPQPITVPDA
jgi:GAF domain-containing protein